MISKQPQKNIDSQIRPPTTMPRKYRSTGFRILEFTNRFHNAVHTTPPMPAKLVYSVLAGDKYIMQSPRRLELYYSAPSRHRQPTQRYPRLAIHQRNPTAQIASRQTTPPLIINHRSICTPETDTQPTNPILLLLLLIRRHQFTVQKPGHRDMVRHWTARPHVRCTNPCLGRTRKKSTTACCRLAKDINPNQHPASLRPGQFRQAQTTGEHGLLAL